MATFLCCSRNPSAHVTDADRPHSALRVCSVPKPATTYVDSAPRLVPCVRTAIAADRLRLGVRQLPRAAAVRDGGQRLVARSRRPHVRPAGRSGSAASVRRTVPLSSVSTRSTLVGEYHEYHPRRCFRPPSQLRADTPTRIGGSLAAGASPCSFGSFVGYGVVCFGASAPTATTRLQRKLPPQ